MPESNLALESSHIADHLENNLASDEYIIVKEDGEKPGFKTDNRLKRIGTQSLKNLLLKGQVRFHKNFFTSPSGLNLEKYLTKLRTTLGVADNFYEKAVSDQSSRAREVILPLAIVSVKEEILNQLSAWKEQVVTAKDGSTKTFYTGKIGGKPDDMAMCMVAACVVIKKFSFTVQRSMNQLTDNFN